MGGQWLRRIVGRLGLVPGIAVNPANTTERDRAQILLAWSTWLRILWVDGGYTGKTFALWVQGLRPKLVVAVFKRSGDLVGFKVSPHRWGVERTFGWLMQQRFVRDYETIGSKSDSRIYIAMI